MPIQWPRNNRPPMMVRGVTRRELRNAFKTPPMFSDRMYKITGVSRDSTGAALGNCIVSLFYTLGDTLAAKIESDASGNFSFLIGPSLNCYIVAYKAGAPEVSGVTLNTLVAA